MSQNLFSIFTDHPEAVEKIIKAIWEDGKKWYLVKAYLNMWPGIEFRFNGLSYTLEELDEIAEELNYEDFKKFLIGSHEETT